MPNQFTHGRALVVGVANYLKVRKLPETVLDDARDVAALLRSPDLCGYPAGNVDTLLDGQATADGIRDGFRRLARAAGPDDTVIVFFSGHGGRIEKGPNAGTYLIPFDCDPKRLKDTAIGADELTELVSAIKAGCLVVLLDACHAGGIGEVKAIDLADDLKAGLDEKAYDALSRGAGRVVMASSRSAEVSLVLAGMSNSLFTHYLLEALRGAALVRGDGLVRVFDVFHYISDKVPARAAQHPIFKAHEVENNFPLALDRGGKAVANQPLEPELAPRPNALSGKARLALEERLLDRWERLAVYFEASPADRHTFERASSPPVKLLDWLTLRKKVYALRDAFTYLGWDDLTEEMDSHP